MPTAVDSGFPNFRVPFSLVARAHSRVPSSGFPSERIRASTTQRLKGPNLGAGEALGRGGSIPRGTWRGSRAYLPTLR